MTASVDALRALINEQLFPLDDTVTKESDLHAEGLDSMALMQLILLLEQEFAISLGPDDLNRENFSTLGKLTAFIGKKQNA